MNDTEIKNGLVIDEYGDKHWYKNDLLHRENDLPAIEYSTGSKEWWLNGKRHRDNDLPAVECENGDKEWHQHEKLHREDGPAVEYASGEKEWWVNDQRLSEEQFNHYLEMKRLNQQLYQDLQVNNHSKIKPPKI